MGLLVAEIAVVAVVCFLIGSVNPAALVGRSLGHDLRTSGSGNPGATNAGRVLGPKWGVLVLVLDVAKAYLPTLLVLRTLGTVPALVAGLSVVLGHVFSPFLRGHGGKGAACALGAVLAVEPWVGLGAVVAFALAKTVLPFVGEASVVTVGVIGLVGVFGLVGLAPFVGPVVGAWLVLLSLLVLSRHRRNIVAWRSRRVP